MFGKICNSRNKQVKKLIKKGDELLEKELDIIYIIENIRKLNKENLTKFIIDVDEESFSTNTTQVDKSLIIDEIIEMQKKTQDSEIRLVNDDTHNKNDSFIQKVNGNMDIRLENIK